ncbi:hypothetical protein ACQ4PT_028320 [Festuca glaucescens]
MIKIDFSSQEEQGNRWFRNLARSMPESMGHTLGGVDDSLFQILFLTDVYHKATAAIQVWRFGMVAGWVSRRTNVLIAASHRANCDRATRPQGLQVMSPEAQAMFITTSTTVEIGDGSSTLFWHDPCIQGQPTTLILGSLSGNNSGAPQELLLIVDIFAVALPVRFCPDVAMQTKRTNGRGRSRATGKITQPAADADSSDRTDTDTARVRGAEDILSRCIISIKRGSTKEACLAIRAAALLAVTFDAEGQDIMSELHPLLTRILELSSEPDASEAKVIAALDCLAVVTFTGAEALDETEASLRVMWGLIHPQSGPKLAGSARKASAQELATAVSAWTFVLTRVTATAAGGCTVNPIEILAKLASLRRGPCRTDSRRRCTRRVRGAQTAAVQEERPIYSETWWREYMSDLAIEAAGTGVDKKGFLEQKQLFKQLSAFMAHGEGPERTVRTSSSQRGLLKVTTWSDVVRLKFLRRFLGPGRLSAPSLGPRAHARARCSMSRTKRSLLSCRRPCGSWT